MDTKGNDIYTPIYSSNEFSPRNLGEGSLEDLRQAKLSLFSSSHLMVASSQTREEKLCSGIKQLDEFLDGGLAFSRLAEWGMPLGQGGRLLMVSFLVRATRGLWLGQEKLWCLWISARQQFTPYLPAWSAKGIEVKYLRVAQVRNPIQDLKPIFIDGFFKVVVIDGFESLTSDDMCFLSLCAKRSHCLMVVLRDRLLSENHSNPFARLRLNYRLNDVKLNNVKLNNVKLNNVKLNNVNQQDQNGECHSLSQMILRIGIERVRGVTSSPSIEFGLPLYDGYADDLASDGYTDRCAKVVL
jgi:hypothetical protein